MAKTITTTKSNYGLADDTPKHRTLSEKDCALDTV